MGNDDTVPRVQVRKVAERLLEEANNLHAASSIMGGMLGAAWESGAEFATIASAKRDAAAQIMEAIS